MGDDFDVIVVGAGMAGSAAALRLAQGGANVLLLERGAEPGQKNLSGGILWGHDLDAVLPNWWEQMPLERHIVRKRFGFLTKDRSFALDFQEEGWGDPPYVAHSVLRARTDPWLARKAEAAGATLVSGVPVESLQWEGRRVRGVIQGGETMTAPVTIVCDGANSRLSLGTPIRPGARLSETATELGIKEVFRLDHSTIEQRFQLRDGEGHAEEWVAGFLPGGALGGGFLYTNNDSISVGLIVQLSSLFGGGAYASELLERFRQHPVIARALEGGEIVEYGAKLISGGWASRPASFSGDGWMIAGDAAGFVFSNGIVIQGMNYAIRTGLLAAETALDARSARDASASQLRRYDQRLEARGVIADFRDFEKMDRVKWNPRFYRQFPQFASELMSRLLSDSDRPKSRAKDQIEVARRSAGLGRYRLAKDAYDLYRYL